jgi:hypothetical protein
MKERFLRFEGHTGEIRHCSKEAPRLVKLGDGSLWQFDKTVEDLSAKREFADYVPAIVEVISWVHPSPIGATENISSIDTQTAEDKVRNLHG